MILKSKKLLRLVKQQQGKCYYCGKHMKLSYKWNNNQQRRDSATIEHIYSKLDIRRYIHCPLVAACYGCNNDRATKEHLQLHAGFPKGTDFKGLIINLLKNKGTNE